MKRFSVILIALALALASVVTIGAAVSSAATCSPETGTIRYDNNGHWVFPAILESCSGVNAVRFYGTNNPGMTGIYDVTRAVYHFDITLGVTILGVRSTYTSDGPTMNIWGQGCGFPAFQVKPFIGYAIRNSNGSTWGQDHQWMNPASRAIC